MDKITTNTLGAHSQRQRVDAWCRQNGITPDAREELLTILYGKRDLIKGESHDRQ